MTSSRLGKRTSDSYIVADDQAIANLTLSTFNDYRTLLSKLNDWRSVKDYGAVANGTTDDSTAINAALAAGSSVVIIPAGTYAIASSVLLQSNVHLFIHEGATIKWTGAAGGTMFRNANFSVVLYKSGCTGSALGATIDANSLATTIFDLRSTQAGTFGRFTFINTIATSTIWKISIGSSTVGGPNADWHVNVVANWFDPFNVINTCGIVYDITGTIVAAYLGIQIPVTLNTFSSFTASDVRIYGIVIRNWTDNNTFIGNFRMSLQASNAIGLYIGSDTVAGALQSVYANTFDQVAVDAFANGNTGRVGIRLDGNSKRTIVKAFHSEPMPEGGAIVDTASLSHSITRVDGGDINTAGSAYILTDVFKERYRYDETATTNGPPLKMLKSRGGASATAGDSAGTLVYNVINSANTVAQLAEIRSISSNVTSGAEAGYLQFLITNAGSPSVLALSLVPTGIQVTPNTILKNATNDAGAAAAGVPIGGFYYDSTAANVIKVRIV